MSDIDNLAYLAGQLHQGAKKFSDAADTLRRQAQQLDWSAEDLASGVDAWAGKASKSFQGAWQRYHTNTQRSATALDATSQALTKLAQKIDDSVDQMRAAQAAQTASSWLTVGLVVVDVVQLGLDPVTDAATVGMAGADVAATEGADAAATAIVEADTEIGAELESIVGDIENVDDLGDMPAEPLNEPGAIDFSEEDPEASGNGGNVPQGTGGRTFNEPDEPGANGLGKLAGKDFQVTEENVQKIETHLSNSEFLQEDGSMYPENTMMIDRLKTALAEGRPISGADASFYYHELYESSLMEGGMDYPEAHAAALSEYEVSPFSVYAPEVIQNLPESFNPNWFNFWNLGGN